MFTYNTSLSNKCQHIRDDRPTRLDATQGSAENVQIAYDNLWEKNILYGEGSCTQEVLNNLVCTTAPRGVGVCC